MLRYKENSAHRKSAKHTNNKRWIMSLSPSKTCSLCYRPFLANFISCNIIYWYPHICPNNACLHFSMRLCDIKQNIRGTNQNFDTPPTHKISRVQTTAAVLEIRCNVGSCFLIHQHWPEQFIKLTMIG